MDNNNEYGMREESEEEYYERIQGEDDWDSTDSDNVSYEELYPIVMEDILEGLTSVDTALYNRMKYFMNLPKAGRNKFDKYFDKVNLAAELGHHNKTWLVRYLVYEWLHTQDMLVAERLKNGRSREKDKTVEGAARVIIQINKVARREAKPADKGIDPAQVMALHKEGVTCKKIGEKLGVCERTIKSKLKKARELGL